MFTEYVLLRRLSGKSPDREPCALSEAPLVKFKAWGGWALSSGLGTDCRVTLASCVSKASSPALVSGSSYEKPLSCPSHQSSPWGPSESGGMSASLWSLQPSQGWWPGSCRSSEPAGHSGLRGSVKGASSVGSHFRSHSTTHKARSGCSRSRNVG